MSQVTLAQKETPRKPKFKNHNLLIIGASWLVGISYGLFSPKKYESQWVVLLPGTGTSTSINVDQLGQANTSSNSAYLSPTLDPRANLKAIATSSTVITQASNILGKAPSEYKAPRVKLIDPTATVEFTFTAPTAEAAHQNAWALKVALEQTTEKLRADELIQKQRSSAYSLSSARTTLQVAQARLSKFKADEGLVSSQQVNNTLVSNQALQDEIIKVGAERDYINGRLLTLSKSLNTQAATLGSSYNLGADKVLQAQLNTYATLLGEVTTQTAVLNNNHPTVLNLKDKLQKLYDSIAARANSLTGKVITPTELNTLLTSGASANNGAADVYASVVDLQAQLVGLNNRYKYLQLQIRESNHTVSQLAVKEPKLLDLEREVKLAEVVYNSVLGQSSLSSKDIYATYPLVQTLVEPTLSPTPISPSWKMIIAGCSLTTIFLLLATYLPSKS